MKRYQLIGALLFAVVLSVNADDPYQSSQQQSGQYQNDQSWQREQDRRRAERDVAVEQYKDASAKQKRCLSDYCRQMYGDQMNRSTEQIYKNN